MLRAQEKVERDCLADHSIFFSPVVGNSRTGPNFWFAVPRAQNRATVGTRTFSAVRKVLRFPTICSLPRFRGFAPGRLAGAFRGHSLVCPATEPADFDVREATSQAQKLAEIAKLVDDFLPHLPAYGLSWPLRYPVLTSMRWTGHRLCAQQEIGSSMDWVDTAFVMTSVLFSSRT